MAQSLAQIISMLESALARLEKDAGSASDFAFVDSLPYRVFATINTKELRRMLSSRGFLISRVVPVLDAWMLSGPQQILESSEYRVAYGLAAEMAQSAPRLFFRNPDNLNKAYEIEKERHAQFAEHFGAPWIVGPAREIENRFRAFMLPNSATNNSASLREMFSLPHHLRMAKTVGMIHDPREGLYFLEDFGVFLAALHNPAYVDNSNTRE